MSSDHQDEQWLDELDRRVTAKFDALAMWLIDHGEDATFAALIGSALLIMGASPFVVIGLETVAPERVWELTVVYVFTSLGVFATFNHRLEVVKDRRREQELVASLDEMNLDESDKQVIKDAAKQ